MGDVSHSHAAVAFVKEHWVILSSVTSVVVLVVQGYVAVRSDIAGLRLRMDHHREQHNGHWVAKADRASAGDDSFALRSPADAAYSGRFAEPFPATLAVLAGAAFANTDAERTRNVLAYFVANCGTPCADTQSKECLECMDVMLKGIAPTSTPKLRVNGVISKEP